MEAFRIGSVLAGAAVAATIAFADEPRAAPSWSYSGATGPQTWGTLSREWSACGLGEQQSPIDLSAPAPSSVQAPRLVWTASTGEIVNDERTIRVRLDDAGGAWMGDAFYALTQFHFHRGSEHALDGARLPLEAHFVHESASGEVLIVAVLFDEGAANPALQALWSAAPARAASVRPEAAMDPGIFLPASTAALHYAGSLTEPPCTENVVWSVFAQPVEASAEEIAAFASAFPANARPLQPRHRRFVLATE